jgi:predicted RNA-binding protein (virulence factor B family)
LAHEHLLGCLTQLVIRRFGPPGAFLVEKDAPADAQTILLPGSEIPEGAEVDHTLDAFVYLDSEDRPVATLREPLLVLGEVGFLTVTALAPFGAFFDWGMPKELLVPLKEQTRELRVGDRHPVAVYVDDTSRLAGTMRVAERLGERGDFTEGEWVLGEAWRKEPDLGVFVIVEKRFVGLVPAEEPNALERGVAARFRVATVLPDGKIELSLRGPAHEEIAKDAARILEVLRGAGAPRVSERSSPEELRALFGLSKKAFKRATGRLLRDGQVRIDQGGFLQSHRPK